MEKIVYQAVPVNTKQHMIYNGYIDSADQRPVEVLKAEIEAKTGGEYNMIDIIDVSGMGEKLTF